MSRSCACLLVAACSAPPPPPPEPPDGDVVFVTEADGAPAVASVSAGGGPVRLLPRVGPAVYPGEARPDGAGVVAIAVDEGGGGHVETLWWLPLDGTAPLPLSPPAGRLRSPSWSADGAWLTVEADWHGHADLYRIPATGGDPGRLTVTEQGSFEPVVSTRGVLAFGSSRDGNAEIYTQTVDGGTPTRVTVDPGNDTRPRWSADGRALGWITDRDGAGAVWWTEDGGPPRLLRAPTPGRFDVDFAWAPDHTQVAVVEQAAAGERAIVVVDVATGATRTTLDAPGIDDGPAWSPDGAWIVYSSAREGDREIRLASADGRVSRRLTERRGADWLPRWVVPAGPRGPNPAEAGRNPP